MGARVPGRSAGKLQTTKTGLSYGVTLYSHIAPWVPPYAVQYYRCGTVCYSHPTRLHSHQGTLETNALNGSRHQTREMVGSARVAGRALSQPRHAGGLLLRRLSCGGGVQTAREPPFEIAAERALRIALRLKERAQVLRREGARAGAAARRRAHQPLRGVGGRWRWRHAKQQRRRGELRPRLVGCGHGRGARRAHGLEGDSDRCLRRRAVSPRGVRRRSCGS